jgi:hypothetical protein
MLRASRIWSGGVSPLLGKTNNDEQIADLSTGQSLRFPTANGRSSTGGETLAIQQPAPTWPNTFAPSGESALFAIVRCDPGVVYENQRFPIFDGPDQGSNQRVWLKRNGGTMGVPTSSNKLDGKVLNRPVESTAVTEESFLAVLRVSSETGTAVVSLDWYSLLDGSRNEGPASAQLFQTQKHTTGDPFGIGCYREALTDGSQPGWPGEIEAIGYVEGASAVTPAEWAAIALGASTETLQDAGYSVKWLREFDGSSGSLAAPAWAVDDPSYDCVVAVGAQAGGSTIRRQSTAAYFLVDEWFDGYVWGLTPGETSRDVTFSGTSAGRTGNVEVRVAYAETGVVLVDWTSLDAVGATWSGTVTVPKCADGWAVAQFRTSGEPDEITESRRLFAVGYKFMQLGQSQTEIYLGSTTLGREPAIGSRISYVTTDGGTGYDILQGYTLGARSYDGPSMFVDQFRAFGDNTPICLVDAAENGTGPNQLMDNTDTNRTWARLQDTLDGAGNDMTMVLMNWITQGWGSNGNTPQNTLEALLHGTGTYSAPIDHYFDAALRAGYSFGVSPGTRHTTGSHNTQRPQQVDGAQILGLPVGFPVADFLIEAAGGPHQDTAQDGNLVFGARMGQLAAQILGLHTAAQPYITGLSRSGGTITVSFELPNGGSLYSPTPAALSSWEVREADSGGFTDTGFTAQIVGDTVELVRDSGTWRDVTWVKYMGANGTPRDSGDAAAETAIVNGLLFETWTPDILGKGIPVCGAQVGGEWTPDFEGATL